MRQPNSTGLVLAASTGALSRRRLVGAAGATLALPHLAHSQSGPVLGFLSTRAPEEARGHTDAFLDGLKASGFVDGTNIRVEYRFSAGDYGRLREMATDLIARGVTVAAAGGDPAAMALKAATRKTPIVFLMGDDPVRVGLVQSLNRPGGLATGVSLITSALGAKRLEMLVQIVPAIKSVALLSNPTNPNAARHVEEVSDAARSFGRALTVLRASTPPEIDAAFARLATESADALIVQNDPFFDTRRMQLIALASHHVMPAIYHIREFPLAGGLASYGPSLTNAYHELGLHTARVLKGADTSTLPVVRPNTFEFVLNIKTASALGLTVSEALHARANEIIE